MTPIKKRAKEYVNKHCVGPIIRSVYMADAYFRGAIDQRKIDIDKAIDILSKTGYFDNDEGFSEEVLKEQFIQCMKS